MNTAHMSDLEAIEARHSVRSYTNEPVSKEDRETLEAEVARGNQLGGLHMRLVWDEPKAFDSTLAHYGKFRGVSNYLVIAGPETEGLDERGGYYGERVVLLAQQLGLNTCWVALTFKKRYVKKMLAPGDKLVLVVALGHGETQGNARRSKDAAAVSKVAGTSAPGWFARGIEAVLLAPTAVNQQKFCFELLGKADLDGKPLVQATAPKGSYTKVDLGIARLHFEIGAGTQNFSWESAL